MGVHRERLAASKAHGRFVGGMRAALRRMGRSVPIPSEISPTMIGAKPLSFVAPPMMEEAFGYRGRLRFVAFGYSPKTRRFGHCDGGDDIPTDSSTWIRFLRHPLIAPGLSESRYPTLFGELGRKTVPPLDEIMAGEAPRSKSFEHFHYLLLDREARQLYVCQRDQLILFFSLVDAGENSSPRVFVDGLKMSPGDENYKLTPAPDLVAQLFVSLDHSVTPSPYGPLCFGA